MSTFEDLVVSSFGLYKSGSKYKGNLEDVNGINDWTGEVNKVLAAHQSELDLAVKEAFHAGQEDCRKAGKITNHAAYEATVKGAETRARLNTFEEILRVCNDNDMADRKWSRGDFIKYMKYELGWNDRSDKPINDAFPEELTKEEQK